MRFIIPLFLLVLSVAVFFVFTNPIYNEISLLRTEVASYDEALNNSKALENERDKLTAKLNSINPDSLLKLQKLLPNNIDNIRLILEIEQIAFPYGMALKDIKYNATPVATTAAAGAAAISQTTQGVGSVQNPSNDYGVWDLSFSTVGSYNNFLNFTRDLESNLRIVDVSSIEFSSSGDTRSSTSTTEAYKYDFKIRTYWLKN